MKINPPLAVLSLVGIALAVLAVTNKPSSEQTRLSQERCHIAEVYLEHVLADEYLGNLDIPFYPSVERTSLNIPLGPPLGEDFGPIIKADPLYPLYLQAFELDDVNPFEECDNLRDFITDPSRSSKFTQVRPSTDAYDEEYAAVFLTISMPSTDIARGEAILFSGVTFAPLAGGGTEVYLRKDKEGGWHVKYEKPTWVS
ncbi:hypothetical protein [Pontixanthobacter aquaemixtae]|uniref:Uncharacterized protein n=1 Tax=Pontixanthobacter aquaemixtae TaxID=1958940 RepID=A0A844ZNT5_9SPHN|nr:hypothetical protein [Pontixanthobacter aquaemixtae]MXO90031.1 hypothetical protein [Pontixanthobacter aquaemixtae]